MKTKANILTLRSSLYSLLLFFYLACADKENCCSFPTDCSGMFQRTGISLQCHQEVEFPREDGYCPSVTMNHQENITGHVELVNVEVLYKVKCPPQYVNEESHCAGFSNQNYIGLNVTFHITGGSVEGIQFNLQTVSGEVEPVVGTLKKSCHNLNFSDVLTAKMAGNKQFSYTNYVGLHPGSGYTLTARAFNSDYSSSLVINIPHCRNMRDWEENGECEKNITSECPHFGKWDNDFFCSIPSPAVFLPEMSVYQNLSTVLTIWPGEPPFTSYILDLMCKDKTMCGVQQSAHVIVTAGEETLHHQFTTNLPAGHYIVKVYGQPDEICKADQHWGSNLCPSASCSVLLRSDLDHCENPHFCQTEHSECDINNEGIASCDCIGGFAKNETSGHCEDINECEIESNLCGANGSCINREGDAYCICFDGYTFNKERFSCEDVNECETEFHTCGGNGHCVNTEGDAYCNCLKGYTFNKERFICEDINECEIESNLCGANGSCINREGDAYCICFDGYTFNKERFSCEDVNECETEFHTCGGNGHCVNTEGDAYCNCLKGYTFNKERFTCEAQIQIWMMITITISVTATAMGIISFSIFFIRRHCYHCRDVDSILDLRTVTSNSEVAQYTPEPLLLKPPPTQPRGPLESIQVGSEEPLMDCSHLRSM